MERIERRAAEIERELADRLGGEIVQRATYWRELLVSAAADDDQLRLRLIADHLIAVEDHVAAIRELRDEAVQRLRDDGVPMTRIAALARVSDSYLSRRLLDKGAKRKVVRGRDITALSAAGLACAVGAEAWLARMADVASRYTSNGGLLT